MTPEEQRQRLNRFRYCEAVTRVLCRRSGLVEGFAWGAIPPGRRRSSAWHRSPPLPFHSTVHLGAGTCRVCGQPIYGGGSFRSFAGARSTRLTWHNACTETYFLWRKPNEYADALLMGQAGLCAVTGVPLGPPATEWFMDGQVDHKTPLYRVARDHAAEPWHELLRFWGLRNLQVISPEAHKAKCAGEAVERRSGSRQPGAPDMFGDSRS